MHKRTSKRDTGLPPGSGVPSARVLVGWKEFVHFPEWRIRPIKAKIDTGARTSALDVSSYELRDDGKVAELRLVLNPKRPAEVTVLQVPVLDTIVVANSGGIREHRPLIETRIRIGPVTKRVRLTITNRSGMRFRMILGRKALEGDFVVDVSQKYVQRHR